MVMAILQVVLPYSVKIYVETLYIDLLPCGMRSLGLYTVESSTSRPGLFATGKYSSLELSKFQMILTGVWDQDLGGSFPLLFTRKEICLTRHPRVICVGKLAVRQPKRPE